MKPVSSQLEELPVERMVKWLASNDVWALAVVDVQSSEDPIGSLPLAVQEVLTEFQYVFEEPQGLSLEREYDHSIPTLPNAILVNSKPYRYSPLHKDDIERHDKELLTADLITPSTSPYASPMLLVQKKDGS